MVTAVKLLLEIAAVFTVIQEPSVDLLTCGPDLPSVPYNLPDIPDTPQFTCLGDVKSTYVEMMTKIQQKYIVQRVPTRNLTGNLIDDVSSLINNTAYCEVHLLNNALNSGTVIGGDTIKSLGTIIIQGYQSQISELIEAVKIVYGRLSENSDAAISNLNTIIQKLDIVVTNFRGSINSGNNIPVEKLTCCLASLLSDIKESLFTIYLDLTISETIYVAGEIIKASQNENISTGDFETTISGLVYDTDKLPPIFTSFSDCATA